ncbi:MAG: hypothetical protein JSS27_18160 [Planctomycetes bacterium]|nr:hypothetical protein [Planctomycetota bacterium]
MDARHSRVPLDRFFSGMAEYTFQTRLGVVDPPMVEYIAELLTRFVHCDSVYKVRNLTGNRLYEVAEMFVEAQARHGEQRREAHRHIGDFTLFWAGFYPEALAKKTGKARFDCFVDYCRQGKRAYHIASTLGPDDRTAENELFERLSQEFDMCVYGLNELRREWEHGDPPAEGAGPIIVT